MGKISVIVPVYNVEAYIGRCLDSLLAQTYADFEIICVDDGSQDKSGEICEQYGKKDARVFVYHIQNDGVGNARNFALSKMSGEWYAFVDADDWVEPTYLQLLYEKATETHCDIAACTFVRNTEFAVNNDRTVGRTLTIEGTDACIRNFICGKDSMQGMVWNKLYRKEIFGDIRFDEKVQVNEDCLYTYEVMKRCQKACLLCVPLYHWFFRQDSACHSKKVACDFTAANVFLHLYEETSYLADERVTKALQKNYIGSVLKVLLYAKYSRRDGTVKEARDRCKNWRKAIWYAFDSKMKGKYIIAIYLKWLLHV